MHLTQHLFDAYTSLSFHSPEILSIEDKCSIHDATSKPSHDIEEPSTVDLQPRYLAAYPPLHSTSTTAPPADFLPLHVAPSSGASYNEDEPRLWLAAQHRLRSSYSALDGALGDDQPPALLKGSKHLSQGIDCGSTQRFSSYEELSSLRYTDALAASDDWPCGTLYEPFPLDDVASPGSLYDAFSSFASSPASTQDSAGDAYSVSFYGSSPSPTLAHSPSPRAQQPSHEEPTTPATPPVRPIRRRNPAVAPPAAFSATATTSRNPWKCPHCPFIQHSRRTPDLKRHIATHGQPDVVWTCRGVPLRYAGDPKYTRMAVPMEEVRAAAACGRAMVGGCMKEFSRKDALTRHLKNRQLSCAGRQAAEEWHCVEN